MMNQSMFVLAVIGLIDSISYMAVSPSLIFYVLQVGGNKEQYGLIMSIFSLASFTAKPVYGAWVDKGGNKFRMPYLFSLAVSVVGALLYFFAASVDASSSSSSSSETTTTTTTSLAVVMVFVGRFLSGLGAANAALGYAYVASVVPPELQTRTSTLLSMTRIVGMTVGPGINYFLDSVDGTVLGFPVDPLNSVGLLLAVANFVTALTVFFLLPEPPEKHHDAANKLSTMMASSAAAAAGATESTTSAYWNACLSLDILLPSFILFAANSCFQLIETALPPAAGHGLGWGPVETSGVLGGTAVIIFGVMLLVMYLSANGVSDTTQVVAGNVLFGIGGILIYYYWTDDNAQVWQYVVPVVVSVAGFPFVTSPNRSNFTKAVMSKPALESSQATMQAILSMTASAAGFITPGFVAAYVIRSSEEADAAGDNRELAPLALYAPVLSVLSLVGLYYYHAKSGAVVDDDDDDDEEGQITGEGTPLVVKKKSKIARRKSSVAQLNQTFQRSSEVSRRASVVMMGLVGFDTNYEQETRRYQLADLEEIRRLVEEDF